MKTRQALGVAAAAGACAFALSRFARSSRDVDFDGASVLIIGGSRGLGLELARQFGAEGAHVTIAARDPRELERARIDLQERGCSAATIICDVRDRTQVVRVVDQVARERGGLDVLVNDAGIIQIGPIDHMTVDDFEDAMATHFWGPLFAMLAALPHMRRAGARRIVNISSIGGKLAVPHLLPYSASKFALTGLSEGVRAELAREGISVTTVIPGLMRTGSTYNARFKGKHRWEFAWSHLASSVPGLSIEASKAARQIIEACRSGAPELIITPVARIAVAMKALAPSFVAGLMATANRLLPSGNQVDGDEAKSGWQSVSRLVPSVLSTLMDRAARRNNEVPT
ncbi:MAG TPA: SDR family NAD(P)-dependent oxidoreductase [Vicinamibacterales bacterium]|nr:SDR family NAD(P)-dependent oxidoreductase [Vicinamibacterales bacterium]